MLHNALGDGSTPASLKDMVASDNKEGSVIVVEEATSAAYGGILSDVATSIGKFDSRSKADGVTADRVSGDSWDTASGAASCVDTSDYGSSTAPKLFTLFCGASVSVSFDMDCGNQKKENKFDSLNGTSNVSIHYFAKDLTSSIFY